MATIATTTTTTVRPYRRLGPIDYARLDYDPNEPVQKPDAMEQNRQLREILNLLAAHVTDFDRRPDVFLDTNTIICYDRRDLNVRVSPDVYLAFGVDAQAIPAAQALPALGSGQATGLGTGDRFFQHQPGGRGPEARHLCSHRRAGILALRSEGRRLSWGEAGRRTGWWPGGTSPSS